MFFIQNIKFRKMIVIVQHNACINYISLKLWDLKGSLEFILSKLMTNCEARKNI